LVKITDVHPNMRRMRSNSRVPQQWGTKFRIWSRPVPVNWLNGTTQKQSEPAKAVEETNCKFSSTLLRVSQSSKRRLSIDLGKIGERFEINV